MPWISDVPGGNSLNGLLGLESAQSQIKLDF